MVVRESGLISDTTCWRFGIVYDELFGVARQLFYLNSLMADNRTG